MIHKGEARAIFEDEKALFVRRFPWVRATQFKIRKRHFIPDPSPRDLAWYVSNRSTVYLLESALTHGAATVRGLIRHELGHAADLELGRPGRERRADRLALEATGQHVRYDKDGIQNAHRGSKKRPSWLHQ